MSDQWDASSTVLKECCKGNVDYETPSKNSMIRNDTVFACFFYSFLPTYLLFWSCKEINWCVCQQMWMRSIEKRNQKHLNEWYPYPILKFSSTHKEIFRHCCKCIPNSIRLHHSNESRVWISICLWSILIKHRFQFIKQGNTNLFNRFVIAI